MPRKLQETDLYEPVRRYLAKAGYTVQAEVKDCDIVAAKGDQLLAVELKLKLNLAVISQAVQRQRLLPEVWIAIARPKQRRGKRWHNLLHLLQRLELGLFLVSPDLPGQPLELVLFPSPLDKSRLTSQEKKRLAQLKEEFSGRIGNYNTGGSKAARMTVYRQQALLIAALLNDLPQASAAQLRGLGSCGKTWRILYDNHYGWFTGLGQGQYTLAEAGRLALVEHAGLVQEIRQAAGLN